MIALNQVKNPIGSCGCQAEHCVESVVSPDKHNSGCLCLSGNTILAVLQLDGQMENCCLPRAHDSEKDGSCAKGLVIKSSSRHNH